MLRSQGYSDLGALIDFPHNLSDFWEDNDKKTEESSQKIDENMNENVVKFELELTRGSESDSGYENDSSSSSESVKIHFEKDCLKNIRKFYCNGGKSDNSDSDEIFENSPEYNLYEEEITNYKEDESITSLLYTPKKKDVVPVIEIPIATASEIQTLHRDLYKNGFLVKELFKRLTHILVFDIPLSKIENIIIEDLFFTNTKIKDEVELTIISCEELINLQEKKKLRIGDSVNIITCNVIYDYLIESKLTVSSNTTENRFLDMEASIVDLLVMFDDQKFHITECELFNENEYFSFYYSILLKKVIQELLKSCTDHQLILHIEIIRPELLTIKNMISIPKINRDNYSNVITKSELSLVSLIKSSSITFTTNEMTNYFNTNNIDKTIIYEDYVPECKMIEDSSLQLTVSTKNYDDNDNNNDNNADDDNANDDSEIEYQSYNSSDNDIHPNYHKKYYGLNYSYSDEEYLVNKKYRRIRDYKLYNESLDSGSDWENY